MSDDTENGELSPISPQPRTKSQSLLQSPEYNYSSTEPNPETNSFSFEYNSTDPRMRTPVMTPVGTAIPYSQQQQQSTFLPPYIANRARQNSNVSLASSISEYPNSLRQQVATTTAINNATFTEPFMALLLEVYQSICSDPTMTPFDSFNPPSGILNKVAKISIEQAEFKNLDIGHEKNSWLLTTVRHRLLQEVRKEGYLSRNASLSSLQPPIFNNNEFLSLDLQQQDTSISSTSTNFMSLKRIGSNNNNNTGTGTGLSRPNTPQLLMAYQQQLQQIPLTLERTRSNNSRDFNNNLINLPEPNFGISLGINSLSLNQNFVARQCNNNSNSRISSPLPSNNNTSTNYNNNNNNANGLWNQDLPKRDRLKR